MKILFIQRRSANCGVSDYGKRLYSILKTALDITFKEVEYAAEIDPAGYDTILYNYHHATLPFIDCLNKSVRHVALFHEAFQTIAPDLWVNIADLPRPLPEPYENDYDIGIPVIGSIGFGFPDKNYEGICSMVRREFDEAIIKLHIPHAQYGDQEGALANIEIAKCKAALVGSNIKLETSNYFMDSIDLVHWLSRNTINIFNCIPTAGRGISSSIDYALSARRPIGVSSSEMYRHLPKEICIDNISLPRLIAQGIEPLRQVYEDNSNEKLIQAVKERLGINETA